MKIAQRHRHHCNRGEEGEWEYEGVVGDETETEPT
jgi:hypothetical protein